MYQYPQSQDDPGLCPSGFMSAGKLPATYFIGSDVTHERYSLRARMVVAFHLEYDADGVFL
jgi:hypothetical protein